MSNEQTDLRVRVPASTSNLASGFDVIGLALGMYLDLSMELDTGSIEVRSTGDGSERLPTDESNLIAKLILDYAPQLRSRGFRVVTHSDIPLTRGFGSSASAMVGALALAQLATHGEIDRHELLQKTTALEGHPDNVSASIYGGLTISAMLEDDVYTRSVQFPDSLQIVALIPNQEILTSAARNALPKAYERADTVFNLQRLGQLISGIYENDLQQIAAGLHDRLHQSYRCGLLPPMADAIDAMKTHPDCLGAIVSGAGPGVIAFVTASAEEIGELGASKIRQGGIETEVRFPKVNLEGVQRV